MLGAAVIWLSLKAAPLYTSDGDWLALVHIVEGLAQWQQEVVDPLLAPGQALDGASRPSALLIAALGWTANAVTAGVLGNAAFELVRPVLGL